MAGGTNGIASTTAAGGLASPPQTTDPRAAAALILQQTQVGPGPNSSHRVDFIEAALDAIADPAAQSAVRAAVMGRLSTVEQGELLRLSPGLTRDAGNGRTVTFDPASTRTQDQWIDRARTSNHPDYLIFARIAGSHDNAAIKTVMTEVHDRGISPSQLLAERTEATGAAATDDTGLALDLTQMGLDVVGIFDQTGLSDAANALISAGRGNWVGAGFSVLAAVPVFGALATAGKLGKWAETVSKAIEAAVANPTARAALEPALRRIHDALRSAPDAVLRALPDNIRTTIEGIRTQLDEFFGVGPRATPDASTYRASVRGQEVILDGVRATPINYVKRDRASYEALRSAFDSSGRASFARSLASSPENVSALRRAGLDDAAITRLSTGRIPQGWQVHHKLPLDDGGTNAFDNLVLIKNDPYHIALTNAQRTLVGDLPVGGARQVDFPIPDGIVYPAGR